MKICSAVQCEHLGRRGKSAGRERRKRAFRFSGDGWLNRRRIVADHCMAVAGFETKKGG
jgi:hypothetical protein